MRRILLALAIVLSAIGLGAAPAAPAQAASCWSSTFMSGTSLATRGSCTGVNSFSLQRGCWLQGYKDSGWRSSGTIVTIYCSSLWSTPPSLTYV